MASGDSQRTDTTNRPVDTFIDGKKMPDWWGPFWAGVHQMVAAAKPHGCVCPVGAEATCKGLSCPRQGVKMS